MAEIRFNEVAISPTNQETVKHVILAVDIETTGLEAETDDIIGLAAVVFIDGKISGGFRTYVNPGYPIPPSVLEKTIINEHSLKSAPDIRTALENFILFVEAYKKYYMALCVHYAPYVISFLRKAFQKTELFAKVDYVDIWKLSKYCNYRHPLENNKLETLCNFYQLHGHIEHDAMSDAVMIGKIMYRMVSENNYINLSEWSAYHDLKPIKKFTVTSYAYQGESIFSDSDFYCGERVIPKYDYSIWKDVLSVDGSSISSIPQRISDYFEESGKKINNYPMFILKSYENEYGYTRIQIGIYKKIYGI